MPRHLGIWRLGQKSSALCEKRPCTPHPAALATWGDAVTSLDHPEPAARQPAAMGLQHLGILLGITSGPPVKSCHFATVHPRVRMPVTRNTEWHTTKINTISGEFRSKVSHGTAILRPPETLAALAWLRVVRQELQHLPRQRGPRTFQTFRHHVCPE